VSKKIIDLRGLEPPEPAVRIVEALKGLEEGESIEAMGDKPFVDIIPKLEEAGYTLELKEVSGFFVLEIRKSEGSEDLKIEVKECDDKLTEITESTNVAKLLKAYPQALKVLVKYGFSPLENPEIRKNLAGTISLRGAKELIGMSDGRFEEMMKELKALEKS